MSVLSGRASDVRSISSSKNVTKDQARFERGAYSIAFASNHIHKSRFWASERLQPVPKPFLGEGCLGPLWPGQNMRKTQRLFQGPFGTDDVTDRVNNWSSVLVLGVFCSLLWAGPVCLNRGIKVGRKRQQVDDFGPGFSIPQACLTKAYTCLFNLRD